MNENSIPSIVTFNTINITDEIRQVFHRDYISNPEYNYKKINRANIACGPMVKWVIAQLEYAEMLNRVDPLRQELKALKDAAVVKKDEAARMSQLIITLEASTNKYKEKYKLERNMEDNSNDHEPGVDMITVKILLLLTVNCFFSSYFF